jgi:FixJ family two-component response regulator
VRLTPREIEVLGTIRGGARSLPSIARALDPPVSPRTAEAHVTAISAKLPDVFEGSSSPLLRVILWVLVDAHTGGPE